MSHLSVDPGQGMADDGGGGTSRPCWVPLCLLVLFLSAILAAVVSRAPLVQKAPQGQGPSIQVRSLSVSNFSASQSEIRGTWAIRFNMSNPNKKMDMSLHKLRVSIKHHGVELGRAMVQKQGPISPEKTREMDLKVPVAMKAANSTKLRKKVFEEVAEEWSKRMVNFDVRMQGTVRFQAAGDSPPKTKLLNLTSASSSFASTKTPASFSELVTASMVAMSRYAIVSIE